MRVILATISELVPVLLNNILNPALEYRAILVDDTEVTKNFIKSIGENENLVYPFYELKECTENFHCDFVLGVSDERFVYNMVHSLKNYVAPQTNFVHYYHSQYQFLLRRAMNYYKKHSAEFQIFATGISYVAQGLDANQFRLKLFNFGRGTQDLYYDYQIAKFVLAQGTGGGLYTVCANRTCAL